VDNGAAEADERTRVADWVERLPPGVVELAGAWCELGRALLGAPGDADLHSVARDLVLPRLLEPDWPEPTAPVRVPGGWVQADLIEGDRESFERLRHSLPGAGPEELAAAAQEWRLPVLPYRSAFWKPVAACSPPQPVNPTPPAYAGSLSGVKVIDMTTLWAGPLATRLMARAGAAVTKIDPECRPDGFRARPRLYAELNAGKQVVDLDLRVAAQRRTFERLLRDADLLVDSFSRRVLPNFGYGPDELRELNPRLSTLSIVGFARGCPERDWLAYGSGIHAISGQGMLSGTARAASLAYPDPLAGYAAFARALEVLGAGRQVEVALVEVAAALGALRSA
jgi:hypothetical protein